jgi:hypothetical protein
MTGSERANHDDNFLTFVTATTTLILSAGVVTLTPGSINANSSRLYVFADRIILSGSLKAVGKTVYLSCNDLQCAANTSINVRGEDKPQTKQAVLEKDKKTLDGGQGGDVVINVHNLPPRKVENLDAFTFFPANLKVDVSGGKGGQAQKSGGFANEVLNGTDGAAGRRSETVH